MAFADLSQYLQNIADKLDAQAVDVAVVQSMQELQGDFLQRVFVQGLDSNNSELGTYSEKPNYYSKEQFVRKSSFKAQGKNGDTAFKVVTRPRKTMYLPQGYKQLREVQARPTDKVNLDYSGSLKNAYRVFKFGSSVVFGQNDAVEHKKIEGLTEKYGDFQTLTDEEKKRYVEYLGEEIKLVIANA